MQLMSLRLVSALLAIAAVPAGLRGQTSQALEALELPGVPVAAADGGDHALPVYRASEDEASPSVSGAPLGAPAPVSRAELDRTIRGISGRSGRLRATVVPVHDPGIIAGHPLPVRWIEMFPAASGVLGQPVRSESTDAPAGPGVYLVERIAPDPGRVIPLPFAVIATVGFDLKRGGYLNGYHIGRYPVEGRARRDAYAPPAGFIEVTPENQDFRVSDHFRLRQFLTKDQGAVWPKYLALDLRLIDKLELVLQELREMGVRADSMHVMSGFRTPQYNGPGGNGRATLSRHTYGDAADVWVDSDGDGYMDDLNGDGRADLDDARVMMAAVERVERRYPALVGGAGVYVANSAHGPFIHIDVRGRRARW